MSLHLQWVFDRIWLAAEGKKDKNEQKLYVLHNVWKNRAICLTLKATGFALSKRENPGLRWEYPQQHFSVTWVGESNFLEFLSNSPYMLPQ